MMSVDLTMLLKQTSITKESDDSNVIDISSVNTGSIKAKVVDSTVVALDATSSVDNGLLKQ